MARISIPEGRGPEMFRVWDVHPPMGEGVKALSTAVYNNSKLSVREREGMRMRVALLNDCGF